jgi:hypothetical protein
VWQRVYQEDADVAAMNFRFMDKQHAIDLVIPLAHMLSVRTLHHQIHGQIAHIR